MADYISREAFKGKYLCCGYLPEMPEKEFDEFPAADVEPVRHGMWIPIRESEMTGWNPEFAGRDPIGGYKCSECGKFAVFDCNDEYVLSDFCPQCGAKMGLEAK